MTDRNDRQERRDARRQERSAAREIREVRDDSRNAGTGPDSRDSYHHKDLKAALLQEGRRLLVEEGLANFSLRRLAQRLGVSHGAPYRHFASREDLLVAMVDTAVNDFRQALARGLGSGQAVGPGPQPIAGQEPAAAPADGEARLLALGEAYVFFYLENPEILNLFTVLPAQLSRAGEGLRALLGQPAEQAGPEPELPQAWNDPGFMILRQTAQAVLGRYPGLEERDVLLGFWAKVHGLACLLAVQPDWFAPGDLRQGVRRVLAAAF